jgi:hypothetical protein
VADEVAHDREATPARRSSATFWIAQPTWSRVAPGLTARMPAHIASKVRSVSRRPFTGTRWSPA